ncbi:hypothetical protein BV20DRAFT_968601 [Pilatotrama ljubarskyi]|nr:hypothetical protein BV20DRAFT_968601 [Pilatotrama ljubarskyi]
MDLIASIMVCRCSPGRLQCRACVVCLTQRRRASHKASQSESPAHALPLRTSPNQRRYTSIVTSVTLSRLPPAAISTRDSVISDASEHTQELSHVPDLSDPPVQQYATAGSYRASGLQSRGTSIGSSLPPAYDDLSDRGREASPIGDASESGPGQ